MCIQYMIIVDHLNQPEDKFSLVISEIMISTEIYKLSQDMCFILYLEFKMIDAFTVKKNTRMEVWVKYTLEICQEK